MAENKKKKTNSKTASTKAPKVKTEYDSSIPSNIAVGSICFAFLILFLAICFHSDGFILKAIQNIVFGLLGEAGFYFSIPALVFLCIIHFFASKTNTTVRSICIAVFVFLCGAIYHLVVQKQGMANGFMVIKDLYVGGINGYTGGVLCGGFAMLLRWLCGNVISYLLLIVGAALTLLGALQITVPSIIRAIVNRPRYEEEEDEQNDVFVEPATIVVNHFANKQIAHKKQQREKEIARQKAVLLDLPEAPKIKSNKAFLEEPDPEPIRKELPDSSSRSTAFMNAIDQDINTPVSGKNEPTPKKSKKATPIIIEKEDELLLKDMPELIPEIPDFVAHSDLTQPTTKPTPESTPPTVERKKSKVSAKETEDSAVEVALEIAQGASAPKTDYSFPPIDLLKRPINGAADGTEEMRENSRRLNETLASFKIDAHIINVTRGPSVTRYEVELDKGVRLSKLTGCADDIALSLGASGVRIAAVPGKISIVGIEVPNRAVTTVSLREVIDSPEFRKAKSKSSFSVGKDIGGSCIVGNIAKMPHMLIAGTTGSGKSVCMNSIIISLLYKASPDDVKLIMVDPKMVELGIYNGIPHLLIPVVTDPKKAAGSLQWAVTEMLRRYKMMSDIGVRDLESYNSIITSEEGGQKLPQVVIIIDELADLMLVAAKEVEDSICRIAQMGRAAGMHLIIATQRPSADVITGLMKANIPSRIAFSVASSMESRIILDTQGAEKLVGKGDMLYAPIGIGKPLRVQGCFVTDTEVEAVAGYVKDNYVPDYNQEVLEEIEKKALQTGTIKGKTSSAPEASEEELEGDEMLPAAVDVILETGQASVSMLQRRLKLGYARAARIVDEMEEKGFVGPFQGSKPRSILITKEKWAQIRGNGDIQMEMDSYLDDTSVPEEIE